MTNDQATAKVAIEDLIEDLDQPLWLVPPHLRAAVVVARSRRAGERRREAWAKAKEG